MRSVGLKSYALGRAQGFRAMVLCRGCLPGSMLAPELYGASQGLCSVCARAMWLELVAQTYAQTYAQTVCLSVCLSVRPKWAAHLSNL